MSLIPSTRELLTSGSIRARKGMLLTGSLGSIQKKLQLSSSTMGTLSSALHPPLLFSAHLCAVANAFDGCLDAVPSRMRGSVALADSF